VLLFLSQDFFWDLCVALINRIDWRTPAPKLRRGLVSLQALYFLAGALVIAALTLYFYHPAETVDLVISAAQVRFRPNFSAVSEPTLIGAVPISFLGIRGFEAFQLPFVEAFWPDGCKTPIHQEFVQAVEPGRLFAMPRSPAEAPLIFDCSELAITVLMPARGAEIELGLRSDESQSQIRLKFSGGQPNLTIAMLSDTIRVWGQDYRLWAEQAGRYRALPSGNAWIGFRPDPEERIISIADGEAESLIFYDIRDLKPETDDLLKTPFRVEQIDFNGANIRLENAVSLAAGECISAIIGDKKMEAWSGLTIHIQKQDLDDFALRQVRALQPGRLQVALRGETGRFRAGVSAKVENRIPSALDSLGARLGLLIGVLLWILNLFFKLREREENA